MILGKKLVVVLPAYNAEKTLAQTYSEIPFEIVDDVVLVDDASRDETVLLAKKLGIRHVIRHEKNKGYGGNQKTCYDKALALGADIVVMLHPDYQYTPKLLTAMASIIANGVYPCVLGSRILGGGARKGGMPLYKYIANRFLTLAQNLLMGQNSPNITRAIVRSRVKYLNLSIITPILTISSSITKCSHRFFMQDLKLPKSLVRPSISRKPRPSISREVQFMGLASCVSRFNTPCRNWDWGRSKFFARSLSQSE